VNFFLISLYYKFCINLVGRNVAWKDCGIGKQSTSTIHTIDGGGKTSIVSLQF
jgi:hypothetical protein